MPVFNNFIPRYHLSGQHPAGSWFEQSESDLLEEFFKFSAGILKGFSKFSVSVAVVQQQAPDSQGDPFQPKVPGWKGWFSQLRDTEFHYSSFQTENTASLCALVMSNSARSSGVWGEANMVQIISRVVRQILLSLHHADFCGTFTKIRSAGFSAVFLPLTEKWELKAASDL